MQKTKVRKDKHGLYFRADGYVFRPVPTKHSKFLGVVTTSQFQEDEQVKARHIGGSPTGKIKRLDGEYSEIWSAHGRYMSYDTSAKKTIFLNSEDLFDADVPSLS